jgi:ribosomal peptide maturation radical SAM protein 1
MKRVALLSMPFGAHRIPKIGIALLKSHLKRSNIECDSYLFDLVFASQVGLDNYEVIAETFNHSILIGEWFFAEELFGSNPEADREYINLLLSEIPKKKDAAGLPEILKLFEIRDQIPQFLKDYFNSVDWSKYVIVGFTTSNQQNCASLAMARLIKEAHPHIKIVFGGANCTGSMAEGTIRAFPFIDFVCQGEGDVSFPSLVNHILNNKPVKLDTIPGIICRCENESTGSYKPFSGVEDLDALPFPDYSDYFLHIRNNELFDNFEPQVPMETSRGCWWGQAKPCVFCGHCLKPGMVFKSKAPRRALEEINYLSQEYAKTIHFSDDVMDYRYYDTLLPQLAKEKNNAELLWEIKVNITKEQMAILSDAGVKGIQPGIESLGDNTLKLINKGTTQLTNISTLKWAKQFGITAYWNILYGFPQEDYLEYERVIKLIPLFHHLEPPFGYSHVRFERFSSYLNDPASFGIKGLVPSKVYNFIYHGLDQGKINDIAFYFDAEYDDNSKEYEARLLEAIEKWKEQKDAGMEVVSSNSSIKIIDTRDANNEREFSFKGLKARLYLLCDKAKSVSSFLSSPEAVNNAGEKEIKETLDYFIEEGLMIEGQGRYLSLAIMK